VQSGADGTVFTVYLSIEDSRAAASPHAVAATVPLVPSRS
jgi:hypothetical protein